MKEKQQDFLQTKTRISDKFFQENPSTLKFGGILEYIASKLENAGQCFQLLVLFHPRQPEL